MPAEALPRSSRTESDADADTDGRTRKPKGRDKAGGSMRMVTEGDRSGAERGSGRPRKLGGNRSLSAGNGGRDKLIILSYTQVNLSYTFPNTSSICGLPLLLLSSQSDWGTSLTINEATLLIIASHNL